MALDRFLISKLYTRTATQEDRDQVLAATAESILELKEQMWTKEELEGAIDNHCRTCPESGRRGGGSISPRLLVTLLWVALIAIVALTYTVANLTGTRVPDTTNIAGLNHSAKP